MTCRSLLVVSTLMLFLPAAMPAGTEPGYQYTYLAGKLPDTLHVEDSPFIALANLYVDSTYVEAGVEIMFTQNTRLSLDTASVFTSAGVEGMPVRLRDAGLGQWNGVTIGASGKHREILLAHTIIENAGGGLGISFSPATSNTFVSIEACEVVSCDYHGLIFSVASNPATIGAMTITTLKAIGNGTGILIGSYFSSGLLSLEGVEVAGNSIGFEVNSPIKVNWSLIRDNTTFDVWVNTPVTSIPSLDFRYNDWGPTTTAEMEEEGLFSDISTIYDWWDDHNYSIVDYSGFSGGSTGVRSANTVQSSWGGVKSLFR